MFNNPINSPFDISPVPTVTITQPNETNDIKHIYKKKKKPLIQIRSNFLNGLDDDSSNYSNNYTNYSNNYSNYTNNYSNYTNNYSNNTNNNSNNTNNYLSYSNNYSNYTNYSNYYSNDPSDNFNINEFDIIKLIGNGEISKIYSVKWRKNGKKYALKKLISLNNEYARNEKQQALVLKNFVNTTKCDGVIKVFGESMSRDKNTQYILMELGEHDWNKEIEDRQRINNYYTENELLNIFTQLINTCALLEKNKISHRDIKPDNIFIVNGKYKLGDFSDSKIISEGRSQQSVRGTEMFMSPLVYKAYRKNNLVIHDSYKSDVYSLGICMLYAASFDLTAAIDIKNIIDSQSTKKFIARNLSMRYSKNFIEILSRILQYDESNRPNFNDLEYMLMNKESNCIIN